MSSVSAVSASGPLTASNEEIDPKSLRRIIFAASLGTLFEWYDFYLYGSLAVFFGGLFFPSTNETAQLLASLATFGTGFFVRPLGALVFGHIGDLVGRKYTFLITMATMGLLTKNFAMAHFAPFSTSFAAAVPSAGGAAFGATVIPS